MQALRPTDSAFLWMETRDQPMHVAGLNLYTPPSGGGGGGAHYVAAVLAQRGQHLSALAPFNLRHLALPYPGRIRELLVMVSRLHGNLMDRNRPLWEAKRAPAESAAQPAASRPTGSSRPRKRAAKRTEST